MDDATTQFDHQWQALQAEFNQLDKINIVIAGKSGVGKSTLINAMFGQDLAETGVGRPVTRSVQVIEHPPSPLRIYDTAGFELDFWAQRRTKAAIARLVKRRQPLAKAMHCLWYCVATPSSRIESAELRFIYSFMTRGIPAVLVLTKSDDKAAVDALSQAVWADERFSELPIVSVMAKATAAQPAFGLKTLVTTTAALLPDALRNSFNHVQKPESAMKRKAAYQVINQAVLTNFGTGFVPIPNAPIMTGVQSTMLLKITAIYQVNLTKHQVETVLAANLGLLGAVTLGQSTAKTLTAAIPAAWLATGAMSGAVAATITMALGHAYIQLMEAVVAGSLDLSAVTPSDLTSMLVKMTREHLPGGGLK